MQQAHPPIARSTVRPRRSLRSCYALAVAGFLLAPSTAVAEVDPNSLTDSAEIVAEALDGGGGSSDRERSGRIGFSEFLRKVAARDRNSDSGRVGRATAEQDTRVLEIDNAVLGVDSSARVEASFTDPDPSDGFSPSAEASSILEVGFDVIDEPVDYVLTGSLGVSVPPDNSCASANLSGSLGSTSASACPGSPVSVPIDLTGTLDPGSHDLDLRLLAEAFGDATSGTAVAEYDLELRFCTVVVEEPGQAALGTAGDDVICGRSGAEQLLGVGGNDIMFGFGGADTDIDGGGGEDRIFGGAGDDLRLYGGPGNDLINGGPGNDGPLAPTPENVVAGGPGDDELIGGPGSDILIGRCREGVFGTPSPICPDDPITLGETDDDNLTGGPADDFLLADGGSNFISGGSGSDIASADGPSVFVLGSGNDESRGGAGSDEMDGGSGNDLLVGLGGDDCLVGGQGKDAVEGDAGNDKLLAKDGNRDTVTGGAGPDRGRFDPVDRVRSVGSRNFQGGC